MGCATLDNTLQKRLELIEGGSISATDRLQSRRIPIHDIAVLLDRLDRVRRRPHSFVGNRRVELCEINRSGWLGTEDEWIVPLALLVDFQLNGEGTHLVQARWGVRRNAP